MILSQADVLSRVVEVETFLFICWNWINKGGVKYFV